MKNERASDRKRERKLIKWKKFNKNYKEKENMMRKKS